MLSTPRWTGLGRAGTGDAGARVEGVAGLLEGTLDEATQREDEQDDDRGDGGDEQAVLDGRGAGVVALLGDEVLADR